MLFIYALSYALCLANIFATRTMKNTASRLTIRRNLIINDVDTAPVRTVFPIEKDDTVVLDDTRKWVQNGEVLLLVLFFVKLIKDFN